MSDDLLRDTAELLARIAEAKHEPETKVLFWMLEGFVDVWKEDEQRVVVNILPFRKEKQ